MLRWEYKTLLLRIMFQKERTGGFFAHHAVMSDLEEESVKDLTVAGQEGWELVTVLSLPVPKEGPGRDFAIAFFRRPAG
jgi:hypothetical protein